MQHRTLVAGAAALLALACCTTGAAAACLDLPPVIDSDSVPAFMSGVLDYFSYPTAVRRGAGLACTPTHPGCLQMSTTVSPARARPPEPPREPPPSRPMAAPRLRAVP